MPDKAKKRGPGRPTIDMRATKTAFVSYLLDPDPSKVGQSEWAKAHRIDPSTLSDWKSGDAFVLELLGRADDLIKPMWATMLAAQVSIAQDRDHPQCVQAFDKLAKLWSKYPNEKVDLNLGRMGLMEWLGTAQAEAQPKRAN